MLSTDLMSVYLMTLSVAHIIWRRMVECVPPLVKRKEPLRPPVSKPFVMETLH
jgi:hypothetical protein